MSTYTHDVKLEISYFEEKIRQIQADIDVLADIEKYQSKIRDSGYWNFVEFEDYSHLHPDSKPFKKLDRIKKEYERRYRHYTNECNLLNNEIF